MMRLNMRKPIDSSPFESLSYITSPVRISVTSLASSAITQIHRSVRTQESTLQYSSATSATPEYYLFQLLL
jgi:hypothetical protein